MTIVNDLEDAQRLIEIALRDLKDTPEKVAIANLIEACMMLEENYKEFCTACDQDFYDKEGTTYRDGISLEFYIESSLWHNVSKALREIHQKVETDE